MKRRRSLYARPEIVRGEQCAEAPAGRRNVTLQLTGRGGGQAIGSVPSAELSDCGSPRRRLSGGASGRHPAIEACRSGQDASPACRAVRRRSACTVRCPPFGVHQSVPSSGVQLSSRPVSSPSSVRSSGSLVRCPAVRCPRAHLVVSVSSRRSSVASEAASAADPAGLCLDEEGLRPTDQGRQTDVRSAPVAGDCTRAGELAEARRSRAAPRGWHLGLEPRLLSVVVVEPDARVDGPGRTNELDGEDGRAAPARPSQEVSATGMAQTTL